MRAKGFGHSLLSLLTLAAVVVPSVRSFRLQTGALMPKDVFLSFLSGCVVGVCGACAICGVCAKVLKAD